MAEYIMNIDYPELCLEYGGTNYTERLDRIVRCKDCKRWKTGWAEKGRSMKCFHDNPDGFCFWGKRKTTR